MERQVKHLFFFPNGNTAVMDEAGQQIPDLQKSWFLMYVEFLQSKGVKVEDIAEINLPNGKKAEYLKDVHNWRIE